MKEKAIVTFVYGEPYLKLWKTYCETNWRLYARKHGYDIILLDKPVRPCEDLVRRPVNWQKLLICSHPEVAAYRNVVFLDADIMINYHNAPCVVSSMQGDGIGAVRFDRYIDDDFTYYQVFIRQAKFRNYQARLCRLAETSQPFKLGGPDFSKTYSRYTKQRSLPLINTGVLCMKPELHRAYLESVYSDSFNDVENGSEKGNYEQEYLSYRLIRDSRIEFMDERFNRLAYYEQAIHYPFLYLYNGATLWRMCLSSILANCFFLHFAGNINLMPFVSINENAEFAMMGLMNPFVGDVEEIRNRGHRE